MPPRPPSPRLPARRLAAPLLLVVALVVLVVSGTSLMRSEVVPRLAGASVAGALTDLAPSAGPTGTPSTPPAAAPAAAATTGPATTAAPSAASAPASSAGPATSAVVTTEAGTEPATTAPDPAPEPVPSTPASSAPAAGPAPAAAAADPTVEGQVLALVNRERTAAGCPALTADPALAAVARAHSADMRDRGYFAHDTPDGVSPWDRAEAAGISTMRAENIAQGQRDAAAVMAAWMESPGHRDNILDCDLRTFGLGVAQGAGGPWWTQDFGV